MLYLDRDSFNRLCGSLFEVLSRNMGAYDEMMKQHVDAKARQEKEESELAKREEIKILAELKEDAEDNAKDAETLAPLPTGPRKKQKATKRHRNSMFCIVIAYQFEKELVCSCRMPCAIGTRRLL